MWSATEEKSNPLSSRQDVVAALNTLLSALDTQFPAGHSRFSLGDTCAHYATDIAQMEGLSRALWGLFPLMASGETTAFSNKYIAAIRSGTDPHSEGYWGETAPYDQRLVEMAAYGLGLALLGTLCFSAGNMLSSLQQKAGLKPLTTNAWGMLYGASMLAVYCALRGIPFEMEWNTRYIGSLLYLVIPGSVIGFTAYLTLVGRMGPERAAYCTVLFPLVALNVSAFAEGYQWTPPALAGLVLVMLGNVLVFRKPRPVPMAAKLA